MNQEILNTCSESKKLTSIPFHSPHSYTDYTFSQSNLLRVDAQLNNHHNVKRHISILEMENMMFEKNDSISASIRENNFDIFP
jgi:hypothetical protein